MKTKLTLLLALAVGASANAEKPNFNGFQSAPKNAVPHAALSYSGGGASHGSHSFNAGQFMGLARSILPLVMNSSQPPPRPSTRKNGHSPVLASSKPATRTAVKPGTVTRPSVSNAPAGVDSKLATGLKAGSEIANGLESLDSLRASAGSDQTFGDVFHQPGNPGHGDQSGLTDPLGDDRSPPSGNPANFWGKTGLHDPASSHSPRGGLTDVRGAVSNGRRAGDEDTDGSWNLGPHEYMNPDGSRHRTSGTETQGTTEHYTPDGKYNGRSEWSSNRSGDHTTTQHFDSDRQHTSTVIVERRSDGTEQKTVCRDGQEAVVTRSDDSAPEKSGTQSCDRNPTEGASLGGSRGPSVADVTGLMPIDLVRQFAEGNPSSGGRPTSYTVTRQSGANQVRPVGEGQQTGIATRAKPVVLTGQGLEGNGGHGGTDGGSGPDY